MRIQFGILFALSWLTNATTNAQSQMDPEMLFRVLETLQNSAGRNPLDVLRDFFEQSAAIAQANAAAANGTANALDLRKANTASSVPLLAINALLSVHSRHGGVPTQSRTQSGGIATPRALADTDFLKVHQGHGRRAHAAPDAAFNSWYDESAADSYSKGEKKGEGGKKSKKGEKGEKGEGQTPEEHYPPYYYLPEPLPEDCCKAEALDEVFDASFVFGTISAIVASLFEEFEDIKEAINDFACKTGECIVDVSKETTDPPCCKEQALSYINSIYAFLVTVLPFFKDTWDELFAPGLCLLCSGKFELSCCDVQAIVGAYERLVFREICFEGPLGGLVCTLTTFTELPFNATDLFVPTEDPEDFVLASLLIPIINSIIPDIPILLAVIIVYGALFYFEDFAFEFIEEVILSNIKELTFDNLALVAAEHGADKDKLVRLLQNCKVGYDHPY
mmetsp:Transcript_10449/g.19093  ORF Transcript_10449/g.19093 Transcript_10449/m.19093 type:complete len:449 (-) Transcript_10449:589-1935(-)